jgi:MinD-like ATPase involved in chromosome partitioning or flagellar assembly
MNILLISSDTALADTITRSVVREGDVLHAVSDKMMLSNMGKLRQMDVVILSDLAASVEDWEAVQEDALLKGRRLQRIMLISNRHDSEKNAVELKHALAEGWEVVQPGLTVRQVAEQISRMVYGGANPKLRYDQQGLIHFIGTTPNIGVTVAAYGAAANMARMTERRIAYLCLNLKSSKIHRYLGTQLYEENLSLDGLRAELRSGSLTGERLLKQARADQAIPNLFVIHGNHQREQADYYTIEEIECLLLAVREVFDYCIVETSAYWDNAATIGVMRHADRRIMVTTPQLSQFQEDYYRWLGTLKSLFELSPSDFDLLVTQYDSNSLFHPRVISKEMDMTRIAVIRKCQGLDKLLTEGRIWDAVTSHSLLSDDLSKLARSLFVLYGEAYMPGVSGAKHRTSWASWMSIRKSGGRLAIER